MKPMRRQKTGFMVFHFGTHLLSSRTFYYIKSMASKPKQVQGKERKVKMSPNHIQKLLRYLCACAISIKVEASFYHK